ncbi:CRAL-TRIO domain-containing protein [Pavlovales sp. CCMP2436]|nr:CRAL-TRIO domain-containing protein [Pavlovales sp. CCMP2436]|mmetsp:Transcript_18059/g.46256  ORF Transcript_18059/g.46256 Transcript_18059/m.46256 type:complete len:312 (-) Transcript_18059:62-997(-)
MAQPAAESPSPGGFDPMRNKRFALATLRERFESDLVVLRSLLEEAGVSSADPGAPSEWGDTHLIRFVLGFGSGEEAARAFCRCVAWMETHNGAERRARFASGATLDFAKLRLMRSLAPMQRIGVCHHGCPVIVHYLGQLKPRKLTGAFSLDEIRTFNMLATERTYCQLQHLSVRDSVLRRSVLILDLGGVGFNMAAPFALAQLRTVVKELTQVYIEMVERVFLVRVPLAGWLQSIAYSLAPERSHHKFTVLGSDFEDELCRYVPREQLPEALRTGLPPTEGWGLQDGDVDIGDAGDESSEQTFFDAPESRA